VPPALQELAVAIALFTLGCYPVIATERIPDTYEYVNDEIHLLTLEEEFQLSQKLFNLEKHNEVRVIILISPHIGDEGVKNYSLRVAETWMPECENPLGAVLFVMDVHNGSVYLRTNGAIAGVLPDITVNSIIRNNLDPRWQEREWFKGINESIDAIIDIASKELTEPPRWIQKTTLNTRGWIEICLFGIAILYVLFQLYKKLVDLRGKRGA